MERVDAAGIVGGGVLTEGARPQDWERRIAERSELLYRGRLLRRLLLLWAGPGTAVLGALGIGAEVLWRSPWITGAVAVIAVGSLAVSARLLYGQHFKVRAVETELRALESAHREHLLEELGYGDLLAAHKRYRAQLPALIERYRGEARRNRWKDNALQGVVIGGSIVGATVSATAVSFAASRWYAVALCLLVAVAAAFAGYAHYRDRCHSWQQTADWLEREYESVELRVGRYRKFEDEREAYAEFADAIEALRSERSRTARGADALGQ
ncbi:MULTISPECIES: DUF4231 domain-containing protein [Saccharopolyspora]|uniref:DUF4231 domain-containing protein n=1 Tax=Saccharopolyspora cebuensis TaxID=418759 RepID=A0ABV4CQQ7_9PSEU